MRSIISLMSQQQGRFDNFCRIALLLTSLSGAAFALLFMAMHIQAQCVRWLW